MNFRRFEIYTTADPGDAGTLIIDLDVGDPISDLLITYGTINGGSTNTAHPSNNLTRIEVVDGSDVLYSLTGGNGAAVGFYELGKAPYTACSYIIGAYQIVTVPILFGRRPMDRELALLPSRFTNPQLKITYDVDGANAGSTVGYITVYATLFDEREISPVGFLMNKEHYSWQPAASAYESIELPRDFPMRRLSCQHYSPGNDISALFREFRLSEDFQKRIPMLEGLSDTQYRHLQSYPQWVERYDIAADSANDCYTTPNSFNAVFGTMYGGTEPLRATDEGGGRWSLQSSAGATVWYSLEARGHFPNGVMDYPLGDLMDMDDWADFPSKQSVIARIRAGTSDSSDVTHRLNVQQLRRY